MGQAQGNEETAPALNAGSQRQLPEALAAGVLAVIYILPVRHTYEA